jgi:DNA-binding GntR family transcriptional regulator
MNRPYPKDRPPQANEVVFWHVLDLMVAENLLPGDVLFETTLAEDLGLSRTPVRSALAHLVAEGFLESPPGKRGYRVPDLSLDDMREVFQMREILELRAAYFAAEQARKEDVDALRELNARERLFSREKRKHDYYQTNVDFHFAVVRIAGNRYLERSFRPVFWRSQLYVNYLAEFHPLTEEEESRTKGHNSPDEHAALIEAIARRDPEGAAKAASDHLTSTRAYRISLGTDRAELVFKGRKR